MHFLINLILDNFNLDDITYVGIASLLGIAIIILLSYIIFIIIIPLKKRKTEDPVLRTMIRKNYWAWIYVFNCFWLSAEIIACWQFNWLWNVKYYIPLWIVFIFSSIAAICLMVPFRKEAKELKNYQEKLLHFKS